LALPILRAADACARSLVNLPAFFHDQTKGAELRHKNGCVITR
jgi:hypothetical protein